MSRGPVEEEEQGRSSGLVGEELGRGMSCERTCRG